MQFLQYMKRILIRLLEFLEISFIVLLKCFRLSIKTTLILLRIIWKTFRLIWSIANIIFSVLFVILFSVVEFFRTIIEGIEDRIANIDKKSQNNDRCCSNNSNLINVITDELVVKETLFSSIKNEIKNTIVEIVPDMIKNSPMVDQIQGYITKTNDKINDVSTKARETNANIQTAWETINSKFDDINIKIAKTESKLDSVSNDVRKNTHKNIAFIDETRSKLVVNNQMQLDVKLEINKMHKKIQHIENIEIVKNPNEYLDNRDSISGLKQSVKNIRLMSYAYATNIFNLMNMSEKKLEEYGSEGAGKAAAGVFLRTMKLAIGIISLSARFEFIDVTTFTKIGIDARNIQQQMKLFGVNLKDPITKAKKLHANKKMVYDAIVNNNKQIKTGIYNAISKNNQQINKNIDVAVSKKKDEIQKYVGDTISMNNKNIYQDLDDGLRVAVMATDELDYELMKPKNIQEANENKKQPFEYDEAYNALLNGLRIETNDMKSAEDNEYDRYVSECVQQNIKPIPRYPYSDDILSEHANWNKKINARKVEHELPAVTDVRRNRQLLKTKHANYRAFDGDSTINAAHNDIKDEYLFKEISKNKRRKRSLVGSNKDVESSEFSHFELTSLYNFENKYILWEIKHEYEKAFETYQELIKNMEQHNLSKFTSSFIYCTVGMPIREAINAVVAMSDVLNNFISYFNGEHSKRLLLSFTNELDKIKAGALRKINKSVDVGGSVLCSIVVFAETEFDDPLFQEKLDQCRLIYDTSDNTKQIDLMLMRYARVYFEESVGQDVMLMRYLFKERVRNGVVDILLFFIQQVLRLHEEITYVDFLQLSDNKWILFEHSLLLIIKKIASGITLSENTKNPVIPRSFQNDNDISNKWTLIRKYPPCIGKIKDCLLHLFEKECSTDDAFKNKVIRLAKKTDTNTELFRSKLFREYSPHKIIGRESFMADFGYINRLETSLLFLPRSSIGDFEIHEILRVTGLIMLCNSNVSPGGHTKKMADFESLSFSKDILNTLEGKYKSEFVVDKFKLKNVRSEKLKYLIKRMVCEMDK